MNNFYYITYLSDSINEGGMARNLAFSDKMNLLGCRRLNMYFYKDNIFRRTWAGLRLLILLSCHNDKIILAHQSAISLLFPMLTKKVSQIVFKTILTFIAKNNRLIIEVNDLPYEQAIDLDLPIHSSMLEHENLFYSIPNCHYIFASNEMSKYVCEKYKIDKHFAEVIINGGPDALSVPFKLPNKSWIADENIKYIYAGSLNKGRQIDQLIDVFRVNASNLLILIGIWGEWLKEIDLPANVIYLGDFEEEKAHYIVSKCDIGLIPYDETKFYYNLCYPTKASFYITAGIPFLSTPLLELQNVFANKHISYFQPFQNWGKFIAGLKKTDLIDRKGDIKIEKHKFSWKYQIDQYFDEMINE
ncbi:hypothetical protein [Pedobacter sp. D749]|uniref:hypothetical protein n=1 Tax=Pedobacter sp. D749 TaxID=2856523 RepID=UPI001C57ED92|nr:hypothetical protein [Pedobacter sp. D749]QXU41674.1 hypothetical protein KYH19_22175 [Pedobacter sp. D749]